jgi:hypothetical protein
MSTDWGNFASAILGGAGDSKQIELVENVIEKTRLGKITWAKTGSTLVANVPGMQLSFVRSSSPYASILAGGGAWDVFSIRSQQGSEIMKVEQSATLFWAATPPTAPPPRGKLLETVDRLYSIADAKGQGDIDNAINTIKNL